MGLNDTNIHVTFSLSGPAGSSGSSGTSSTSSGPAGTSGTSGSSGSSGSSGTPGLAGSSGTSGTSVSNAISADLIAAEGDVVIGLDSGSAGVISKGPANSVFGVNGSSVLGFYESIASIIPMVTLGTHGTLSDTQIYGHMVWVSGTSQTTKLPPVVEGGSVWIYSADALEKIVDPDDADGIRNGTARNADGHNITSGGGQGDYVYLVGDSEDGWTVMGKSGTWTDE